MSDSFIAREANYFNEKGEHIIGLEPMSGDIPEDVPRFFAHIRVPVGQNGNQTIHADSRVPIDADTIEEAFTVLKHTVDEAVKMMRAEAQKQMATPKLVLPGGAR